MDPFISQISELFARSKEWEFTDRTEIMELLQNAVVQLNENKDIFRIYSIHGMGGIGKTRLIKEFSKLLPYEPIINISFEIGKRSEVINCIYQIRKLVKHACPVFDYALIRYWELTNPATLNDDFSLLISNSFFTDLIDFVAEITGTVDFTRWGIIVPKAISANSIVALINDIYRKIPQIKNHYLFKAIAEASNDDLLNKLPIILGLEINRHIISGEIEHPIFIFDAYQESRPYSESEEWLYHLINAIGSGLFIVTSREPVHWSTKKGVITPHLLECYPEDAARELLEKEIVGQPELVDQIIESTNCIPIYIDLALSVYEREAFIEGKEVVEKALFNDRHKLVQHFVSHLSPAWQDTVIDLATIRVFNYQIFEHLASRRMINCTSYEYDSIIKSNLFNYISENNGSSLIKLHDIFCKDVQISRSLSEFYHIFKTYTEYICFRRDYLIQECHGASLSALLNNILSIAIILEKRIDTEALNRSVSEIDTEVIEQILDIFFALSSNRIRFIPPDPERIDTQKMKKVCMFIFAKTYEKENTLQTIKRLEAIDDTTCFGKHSYSYEAVLHYSKSLVGDYDALEKWVSSVSKDIAIYKNDAWFYNRLKNYQADCEMLNGRFLSAQTTLTLLENENLSPEDYYSIHRTRGHIFRFNMLLSKAEFEYDKLFCDFKENPVFREYLYTNLCETRCFFPSKSFIRKAEKFLSSMELPYNAKNKGKVLYALAIANTVKGHYVKAQRNIDLCITINKKDGYKSGILFAYIAQAYLEYSKNGYIVEKTKEIITDMISSNGVYRFFLLPLAIMEDDVDTIIQLKGTFEWIDFEQTRSEYERFISQLQK